MSSDSDNDSNSSGDDQDQDYAEQAETLRAALKRNPNDYASRVSLIKALRAQGNLTELRDERDDLATRFPLPEGATKLTPLFTSLLRRKQELISIINRTAIPNIWRQWLADEEKLLFQEGENPSSAEDVQRLLGFFERAVSDYLSPDIWLDYCSFVTRVHLAPFNSDEMQTDEKQEPEEALISEEVVRETFEEALGLMAYHIPASHRIWQSYRKFEEALADMAASKSNTEVIQVQLERIRKLYSRQLHRQSLNMEEVYEEYVAWEKKVTGKEDFEPSFKDDFEKNLEQLADRADYEVSVHVPEGTTIDPSQPDYLRVEKWRAYIKFEEEYLQSKKSNPARTRCLYERALQQYSLTFDLWESYSFFMMSHYRKEWDAVIEVQLRAVRNYPYAHSLWCHLISTMDRANKSKEDISVSFEKSLSAGLQSAYDFLQVYKAYSDHRVRRITDWTDATQTDALLRLFDANVEYFQKYFADEAADLEKYYATIVEVKLKDNKLALTRWEALVSKHGKVSANWLAAVEFAVRIGDVPKARNFLKRAAGGATDNSDTIWKAWQDFERLEGTQDELALAVERCTKAQRERELKYYNQQMQQAAAAAAEGGTTETGGNKMSVDKSKSKKRKADQLETEGGENGESAKKRRKLDDKRGETKGTDRKPLDRPGKTFDPKVIHVSGLPVAWMNSTEVSVIHSTIKPLFEKFGEVKAVRTVQSFEGGLKPAVYVEFAQESECQSALNAQEAPSLPIHSAETPTTLIVRPAIAQTPRTQPHEHVPLNRTESSKPRTPGPRQPHTEQFTIYVSNLSFRTNEETLEKFFSGVEGCKDPISIRLIKDHNTGKSRGFAYVQFSSQTEVNKAVAAKNDHILDGRRVSAAPSKPPATGSAPVDKPEASSGPAASMPPPAAPVKVSRPQGMLVPRAVQRKRLNTGLLVASAKPPAADTNSTSKPTGE